MKDILKTILYLDKNITTSKSIFKHQIEILSSLVILTLNNVKTLLGVIFCIGNLIFIKEKIKNIFQKSFIF